MTRIEAPLLVGAGPAIEAEVEGVDTVDELLIRRPVLAVRVFCDVDAIHVDAMHCDALMGRGDVEHAERSIARDLTHPVCPGV